MLPMRAMPKLARPAVQRRGARALPPRAWRFCKSAGKSKGPGRETGEFCAARLTLAFGRGKADEELTGAMRSGPAAHRPGARRAAEAAEALRSPPSGSDRGAEIL